MKIEYKVYCHEHAEEINIVTAEIEDVDIVAMQVEPCSQCMSESYEKGIESVLAKGWERKGRYEETI